MLLEAKLDTASLVSADESLANQITVFSTRVRIDVQTVTPGLHFEDAWRNREVMEYRNQKFYVAARNDLIASKRAVGRKIDLEDVRLLELSNKQKS